MNYAIQTKNLSKFFGQLKAVDQINIEVQPGTIFGFLGPNGSGKTTTIRLLLGLLEPTEGSSMVMGFDSLKDGQKVRENCGALLEHTGLYERLTAVENLDFYGRVWHLSSIERKNRIKELLEKVDLYNRRDEIVKGWSRGMKQKLAVSRVMLHRPKVIFLDEPTAGLDPVASSAFREDLLNLVQHTGVTVFLTTHNLTEAEKLCQQVGVIKNGKLLMVGSPDELKLQKGSAVTEIVGSGFSDGLISSINQLRGVESVALQDHHLRITFIEGTDSSFLIPFLVQQGVVIDEVRKGKASLEDVFLTMMEDEND